MALRHPIRLEIQAFLLGAAMLCWPGAAAFGQATAPTRQQIETPPPAPESAKPRVAVDAHQAVATSACALDRYDLTVTIRSIAFAGPGGAALPPEIATLLAPIAGAPPAGARKIAVVCDIRDRATEALRRAGYVASVQIPPQAIETGALSLEVITARIVEVRVRGDAGPYQKSLQRRIDQLKALSPLNERDAERILLLAGDIPGLDVQLALRPAGTAPGDVIGDLTVLYKRFSILANVQNYGSRQLGRETGYLRGELYGLTGADDLTYLGGQATAQFREQKVLQGGQIFGFGGGGTTIGLSGTYAWSRPDVGQLDLRSRSLIAGLRLTRPLVRAVDRNLRVIGGFELIEQRTRVYGKDANGDSVSNGLNRDKIRVALLRLEGDARRLRDDGSQAWSLSGGIEIRQGLDILGATKPRSIDPDSGYTPTRFEGHAAATVIKGEIDGVIGLGPIFSIAGAARGQWSNKPLLNFEEFSFGNIAVDGVAIGRGYDPGANSADRAVALSAEVRANVIETRRFTAQLFGFYDSVWIYNLDTNAIENDRRLGSWGGGVRATFLPHAYLEALYAHPTDPALLLPGAKRSTDRVLVSLTVQFAPGP